MTTLKQRFQLLKERWPAITQADLARATGAKPPSVNAWFTGETKSMKADTAAKAAAVYGVNPTWLATGQGEMIPPSQNVVSNSHSVRINDGLEHAGRVKRSKFVAVVGTARLGNNGFYDEVSSMPGAGDGLVEAYSDDKNAYALKVRGDSMYPSIRDGWFVIVEPSTQASPGEFVLLKLLSGQKMVKELILKKPDGITVVSVNGDTRQSFGFDELDPHFGVQAVAAIVSPRKWLPD